jgi:thymidine phosphorylase
MVPPWIIRGERSLPKVAILMRLFQSPRSNIIVLADSSGELVAMDAMKVGVAAWRLGAGRSRQDGKRCKLVQVFQTARQTW